MNSEDKEIINYNEENNTDKEENANELIKGSENNICRSKKDQWKNYTILVLLLLLIIGGGIIISNWNRWFVPNGSGLMSVDEDASDWAGEKAEYDGQKNTDSIDIPGFDYMKMRANTTNQAVNFYNPEANICYMKMSLILADGQKLWESKLLKPGKAYYNITLSKALPVGTYNNTVLKYECFAMDGKQTPLNGSEMKFTLDVIE